MNQGKKGAITPLQLPDGRWMIRYSAPRAADGRRVQRRVYGADQAEAWSEYKRVSGQREKDVSDRKAKFGPWLSHQIDLRQSEGQHKESTVITDRRAADLYLIPALGHLRLEELRRDDFRELGAAIRQLNRDEAAPSDMLGRLIDARSVVHGVRKSARPVGENTIRRTMASASAFLAPLVADGIIPLNPAGRIRGPRVRRPKPALWEPGALEYWEQTGKVPSVIMLWTPEQTRRFLQSIAGDRLLAMYLLAAATGLRRSELAGLHWRDVDLDGQRLHVRHAQVAKVLSTPKSEEGERTVGFDAAVTGLLREWKMAQRGPDGPVALDGTLSERHQWGSAWTDSGRVFTRENGLPLRPAWISEHFDQAVRKAGLPPVHLHALRHGYVTMLRALGYSDAVIARQVGHSKASEITGYYGTVTTGMRESMAADVGGLLLGRVSTESDGGAK